MQASSADASGVERVPRMTALAEPLVLLAGRPAAEQAADRRRLRSAGLLRIFKLAIWNDDRIVRDGSHTQLLCPPVSRNQIAVPALHCSRAIGNLPTSLGHQKILLGGAIMALPALPDRLIEGTTYRLKLHVTSDPVDVIYEGAQEGARGKTYVFREISTQREYRLGGEEVQERVTTR